MDEMMKAINQYANGTYLKVEWEKGLVVIDGKIDTIFETNNGFEEEENEYKEYYACVFKVENIIKVPKDKDYNIGNYIEISVENEPTLITIEDGSIIWKKDS